MKGKRNSITDVEGVLVGHKTIAKGDIQTGVTAITLGDDIFHHKIRGNAYVYNGYGKSIGLIQLMELNTIETPILLTNTLSTPFVASVLNEYMIEQYEEIGVRCTVNPLVLECNDSYLNNNRKQSIKREDVLEAINSSSEEFKLGAVGAGRGMSSYQLKGGIGTASRIIEIQETKYTIGALTLTNMGRMDDLIYQGKNLGKEIKSQLNILSEKDKGSIIMILATDLPLDSNQLRRISKRAIMGLSKTGTYGGHGSGDIVITFTTDSPKTDDIIQKINVLHDDYMDEVFKAANDLTQECVYSALEHAETVESFNTRYGLKEFI